MTSSPTTEQPLTDDELCEMALAADPDRPLDEDARPLSDLSAAVRRRRAAAGLVHAGRPNVEFLDLQRVVAAIVILAFLVINALGLCITYGVLEIA